MAGRKFGKSIVKSPEETEKAVLEAEKGLAAVRDRVPQESYDRCLVDIEKVRNPPQIDFHWEDGGKFQCEDEDSQDKVLT
jgi:hypothetical protein